MHFISFDRGIAMDERRRSLPVASAETGEAMEYTAPNSAGPAVTTFPSITEDSIGSHSSLASSDQIGLLTDGSNGDVGIPTLNGITMPLSPDTPVVLGPGPILVGNKASEEIQQILAVAGASAAVAAAAGQSAQEEGAEVATEGGNDDADGSDTIDFRFTNTLTLDRFAHFTIKKQTSYR